MQTMREKWTDERLDDLNSKVDGLRAEMNARFDQMDARMDARFDQVNARFDALGQRFDTLYRTLLGFVGALLIALIASNLAS